MNYIIKCPILLNSGGSNIYSSEYILKAAEIHKTCTLPEAECPKNNPPVSEEDYLKALINLRTSQLDNYRKLQILQ